MAYLGVLDVILNYTDSVVQTLADALEAAKTAVALDDRDAFAHFALGRTQGLHGNSAAAIAETQKAIQLCPSFALAHYGLGYILYWYGRGAEGIPHFDTAIRLSPHDPLMWAFCTVKGWCHFQLGDFDAAEACGRKAVQEGPQIFWAHLVLAAALTR